MKTKRSIAALLSLATLTLGVWALPAGASEHEHQHHHLGSDILRLQIATARFHSISATLRSGRVDLHLCVDMMGQHYADPATFSDGILDPRNPEAMVYEDKGTGHLRLVAVEWVSTTPGEVLGIPLHFNPDVGLWVLHAWIWKFNPDGLFADMNPRVGACPT